MIEKIGIAILPVLVAALLASIISRKNKDKERFNLACDNLHQSFLDTVNMFSNQDITAGLYEHLVASFPLHKKAVIDFRRHLNWFRHRGLDGAWNDYRYGIKKAYPPPEKELQIPHLVQYYEGLAWNDEIEETKKLVLRRIHKILSYAKSK